MTDSKLAHLIAARVLGELQAPSVNASEPDRSRYRSYSDEVLACRTTAGMRLVPIGISARHAHVTQEHLETLFGAVDQGLALPDFRTGLECCCDKFVQWLGRVDE